MQMEWYSNAILKKEKGAAINKDELDLLFSKGPKEEEGKIGRA